MGARTLAGVVVPFMVAGTGAASAQVVRPSQAGTVTQAVARTRIEITYRRPTARGRELFGALVPWGRVWSPSADSAATISFSAPVEIDGERVGAGRYAIWAIPDSTSWTVILSTIQPVFHLGYREGHDALRLRVAPRQGEQVETLAFYFPMVDADSATLNLHWGRTIVPLSIRAR